MDVTPGAYGREVENYLCRRNGGHLIRIQGPTWEMVCGWEARGIPIKVVFGAIDRCVERHEKRPRRRPIPIEFCEADVLDAFDHWRRAAGITLSDAAAEPGTSDAVTEPEHRHGGSLPAHLERVIARLTVLRAGADRTLDDVLDAIVRELDGSRATAKGLRGEAREAFLGRLQELDSSLIVVARERLDPSALAECRADADAELAPFRQRLAAAEYERAHAACVDRLVRERYRLPLIAFE